MKQKVELMYMLECSGVIRREFEIWWKMDDGEKR